MNRKVFFNLLYVTGLLIYIKKLYFIRSVIPCLSMELHNCFFGVKKVRVEITSAQSSWQLNKGIDCGNGDAPPIQLTDNCPPGREV